jgi:hypothetical protein
LYHDAKLGTLKKDLAAYSTCRHRNTFGRHANPIPMIVAIIALAVVTLIAALVFGYRAGRSAECPTCRHPGLRTMNWILATILVDGRRAPDSWSYHRCDACGGRFKLHAGAWEVPSAEEWDRHCSSAQDVRNGGVGR